MRIGIVSPYSLTVPGGVQAQVLGLARELRRRGHEARVLGPCDGPPPESFITPLGDSLPLSANGSVAPIAPDPAAALRTLRVLHDEQFDVIHLHEPLAPGPTSTALMVHRAPAAAEVLEKEHGISCTVVDVRSLVPVSVRREGERGVYNNRVSAMFAELPVGIADPIERLAAIHQQMQNLKESHHAVAAETLTSPSG